MEKDLWMGLKEIKRDREVETEAELYKLYAKRQTDKREADINGLP